LAYTPLGDLQYTLEPPAGTFGLGRALHNEHELLFFRAGGKAHLVYTEDWRCFEAAAARSPALMQIGLHIEPDISSAFDPQRHYCLNGTFALSGVEQSLYLQFINGYNHFEQDRLAIIDAEHTTTPAAVAFSRWALVRGAGRDREVVREFDVGRAEAPVR
jgi:hypothetical protein